MSKRISSKDIFGHVGNVTGDEALAMLKTKEDMKEAVVVVADAKKDQAKNKRAKVTWALVTTGSKIMQRREQLGPIELLRLKIDELHAMLVNADPIGSIPEPINKTRVEKAKLLPVVQAALRRFFVVAVAFAAQDPSLLPIPFAPMTCEGENISNYQVEGLPENFLPIFDPVFP